MRCSIKASHCDPISEAAQSSPRLHPSLGLMPTRLLDSLMGSTMPRKSQWSLQGSSKTSISLPPITSGR
jgi:hypothetical protein